MDQPPKRSKWVIPFVAVVSFVLGVVCGGPVWNAARSAMGVLSVLVQSTSQKARADISDIKQALDAYAMYNDGDYPATLTPLVTLDQNGHRYFSQRTIPTDPWGMEYGYEPPTPGHPQPRVFTLGKDKKPGGTGDDADIDHDAIANGR